MAKYKNLFNINKKYIVMKYKFKKINQSFNSKNFIIIIIKYAGQLRCSYLGNDGNN